ncbi:hypothetical protein N7462_005024 [Penicillium macrosclerotiorum]|uniref:uncharacterized protein n=1 Tax=Penicillium macrosclerotiorum TaxID=303699 RepID=UPI002547C983|nr:uncharacterized protein N7462_005024 [Penicillium macrosclerotiorum]KAJ5690632.1 hypothetical protein N7462_005024 [Penicillium macrosclerotiorum]
MTVTFFFSTSLLFCLWATTSVNATVLRYKTPIPQNAQIVDTKPRLAEIQRAHSGTLLFIENGGYYLKYPESGEVLAVSSDILSVELDRSHIFLSRTLATEGYHEEAIEIMKKLGENGADVFMSENDDQAMQVYLENAFSIGDVLSVLLC